MEDIIKKKVIESDGKVIRLILKNGFKYEGYKKQNDERAFEFLDIKTNRIHFFDFEFINYLEVLE